MEKPVRIAKIRSEIMAEAKNRSKTTVIEKPVKFLVWTRERDYIWDWLTIVGYLSLGLVIGHYSETAVVILIGYYVLGSILGYVLSTLIGGALRYAIYRRLNNG